MKAKRWMKFFLCLVLTIQILILTCFALPSILGFQCYTVISGSMQPALPVGCAIYVKKEKPELVKKGNIITYTVGEEETRVTHRVLETDTKKRQFVTKGDANKDEDAAPVKWERMQGVVCWWVPKAGYLLRFLGDKKGKAAVLCSLLFVCVSLEFLESSEMNCKKKGR